MSQVAQPRMCQNQESNHACLGLPAFNLVTKKHYNLDPYIFYHRNFLTYFSLMTQPAVVSKRFCSSLPSVKPFTGGRRRDL